MSLFEPHSIFLTIVHKRIRMKYNNHVDRWYSTLNIYSDLSFLECDHETEIHLSDMYVYIVVYYLYIP